MGHRYILQPNGRYAVFSTINDDIILSDATLDDVIELEVNDARADIIRGVERGMKNPWTPEHAAEEIREAHGDERAAIALRQMLDPAAPAAVVVPRPLMTPATQEILDHALTSPRIQALLSRLPGARLTIGGGHWFVEIGELVTGQVSYVGATAGEALRAAIAGEFIPWLAPVIETRSPS